VVDARAKLQAIARAKLPPVPVAPTLQRAISALQVIAEKRTASAGTIAAASQPGGPSVEPTKPDGYDEAAIRILEELPPPPRPSHHVVIDPVPASPLPADPADAERQALHERGRELGLPKVRASSWS
jgi:hypothetical protein